MLRFENNKINTTSLSEQISDKIEEAIVLSGIPGEKLPSENDLCKQFGVSRTIIRESLSSLRARGLIFSKVGGGAYITIPEANDVAKLMHRIIQMNNINLHYVYFTRSVIEIAACKEATKNITDEELDILENQIDSMEKYMYQYDIRIQKDMEFHVLIGKFSKNPLLAIFVESISDLIRDFIKKGIYVSGGNEDGVYRHRKIFDALKARDPQLAGEVMEEHIKHSLENVLKQQQQMQEKKQ